MDFSDLTETYFLTRYQVGGKESLVGGGDLDSGKWQGFLRMKGLYIASFD